MILTDVQNEARALVYLAEQVGVDPEVAAAQWHEATMAEAHTVVHQAKMVGLSEESEWAEDFLSAHRWLRRNPRHPEAVAAITQHGLS